MPSEKSRLSSSPACWPRLGQSSRGRGISITFQAAVLPRVEIRQLPAAAALAALAAPFGPHSSRHCASVWSNPFLAYRDRSRSIFRRCGPAGDIKSGALDGVSVVSGTKGSNPLCSSGESMRTWLRFHVSTVVVRFSPVAADARRGSLVALFPVRPVMLIAGDDPSKKPVVMSLVAKLGFEPVDAGPPPSGSRPASSQS